MKHTIQDHAPIILVSLVIAAFCAAGLLAILQNWHAAGLRF
jgi:hypothetical protein